MPEVAILHTQEQIPSPSQEGTDVRSETDAAMQDIRTKALQNLSHPDLVTLAEQEYTELQQALTSHEEACEESCAPREEFLADIKALERIQNTFSQVNVPGGDTAGGLENMIDFISSLQGETQEALLHSLSENRARKLKKYFEVNGFLNSETYPAFMQSEFGDGLQSIEQEVTGAQDDIQAAEIREDVGVESAEARVEAAEVREDVGVESAEVREDVGVESAEVRVEAAEVRSLNQRQRFIDTIIEPLRGKSTIDSGLNDLFTQYESEVFSEEDISAFNIKLTGYLNTISQSPQEFARVMNSVRAVSQEGYESLKTYAVSLNTSLSVTFEEYESGLPSVFTPSQRDAGTDVTREMNESFDGADMTEEYDFSSNPPSRSLSLEGSEYQLDANLPVGDYYPATVEYTEEMQEITPRLQTIDAVLNYLESIPDTIPFSQVVDALVGTGGLVAYTLRKELGCDNLSQYKSVAELKSGLTAFLETKKQKFEQDAKDAKEAYETACQEIQEDYKKTIRERQEKQKAILMFLRKSGFDLIPQSFTDRIIEQVNLTKNIDLGNGMSINSDINIANGEFGYDAMGEEGGRKEQEAFMRLINKMLTGHVDGEQALVPNPTDFVSTNRIMQDTVMRNRLNHGPTAIISSSGGLDMQQVYQNLGYATSGR